RVTQKRMQRNLTLGRDDLCRRIGDRLHAVRGGSRTLLGNPKQGLVLSLCTLIAATGCHVARYALHGWTAVVAHRNREQLHIDLLSVVANHAAFHDTPGIHTRTRDEFPQPVARLRMNLIPEISPDSLAGGNGAQHSCTSIVEIQQRAIPVYGNRLRRALHEQAITLLALFHRLTYAMPLGHVSREQQEGRTTSETHLMRHQLQNELRVALAAPMVLAELSQSCGSISC